MIRDGFPGNYHLRFCGKIKTLTLRREVKPDERKIMKTIQKKVCLVGDFAVGKTSLVRQYVEGRFDDRYLVTIGVKLTRKTLRRAGHVLNMILWDIAGQQDAGVAREDYLRGLAGAFIVCDLTRRETIESLDAYIQQIQAINTEAKIVLLANKYDLEEERQVSKDGLDGYGSTNGFKVFETSAKDGFQVEAAFEALADQFLIEAEPEA